MDGAEGLVVFPVLDVEGKERIDKIRLFRTCLQDILVNLYHLVVHPFGFVKKGEALLVPDVGRVHRGGFGDVLDTGRVSHQRLGEAEIVPDGVNGRVSRRESLKSGFGLGIPPRAEIGYRVNKGALDRKLSLRRSGKERRKEQHGGERRLDERGTDHFLARAFLAAATMPAALSP